MKKNAFYFQRKKQRTVALSAKWVYIMKVSNCIFLIQEGVVEVSNTANSCSIEVTVLSAMGLHARPAAQIAGMTAQSGVKVQLTVAGDPSRSADGSSVLEMLILAAVKGTVLKIEAEGDGAEKLLSELSGYFSRNFDEI